MTKAQAPLQIRKPNILFITGQATLEFTLIFVIIIALILSLLAIWRWSTENIVRRQIWYNTTRQNAGSIMPKEFPPQPTDSRDLITKKLEDKDMAYPEN